MVESMLSFNFDIIFSILSLLPIETLLQVKLVCRAWAQIITNPTFAQAHCSRSTPITGCFMLEYYLPESRIQGFKRLPKTVKFPNSLSKILRNNFKTVSSNHGLLCFRRGEIFLVGNPVTSQWVVLSDRNNGSGYEFHGAALLYDLNISFHFKLAVAMVQLDGDDDEKHYIRFHTYSSENSSWTVSSVYTQTWHPRFMVDFGIRGHDAYKPSNTGGGSLCWMDDSEYLVRYEISTDTYWKTRPCSDIVGTTIVTGYDGILYYINMCHGVAKVWRLEENDRWFVEGECSCEKLPHNPFSYDHARGALLVVDRKKGSVFALDLATSKFYILFQIREYSGNAFILPPVPHANTLAPLHVPKSELTDVFDVVEVQENLQNNFFLGLQYQI